MFCFFAQSSSKITLLFLVGLAVHFRTVSGFCFNNLTLRRKLQKNANQDEGYILSNNPLHMSNTKAERSEISINPLISSVKMSKTIEILSIVKQMEAEGISVTSLCVGEPDFPPHQAVLDAAKDAIENGGTRYTSVSGTLELRNAISDDLRRRKGLIYHPNDIVVSNGAKQCIFQAIMATCGHCDTVLIPAPYWPSYPEMVELCGAQSVSIPCHKEDGYVLTPDSLRSALECNAKTKLLIICNPSNSGFVYTDKHLRDIAAVLEDYPHVAVLSDEIYERYVYTNDGECSSIASMPSMFNRTMIVSGFSKAYAMTGMRIGYLAAPPYLARAVTTIQSQLTSCASSISQAAGLAALTQVSEGEVKGYMKQMKQKRDYVMKELSTMKGVQVLASPTGAFYVLPDLSQFYDGNDEKLCLDLLQKKKLALVPGSALGVPGTVRISYSTSMEDLKKGMKKMREFLEETGIDSFHP